MNVASGFLKHLFAFQDVYLNSQMHALWPEEQWSIPRVADSSTPYTEIVLF